MTSAHLVGPVKVGALTAPSRVVFGPHETNLGDGRAISDRHVAYYARRARGGSGVIITETASVVADDWPYERAPLAGGCSAGWEAVKAACRPFGTVVLAGLGHAGSQGSSAYSQSVMWAPSRVADVVSREPPAELDHGAINELVGSFARAAARAVEAGLDGVEIDAGAWSLLRQFQSGLTNLRADDYGRDRLLFTTEVISAVRRAVGSTSVVALRLSCDELAPWAGVTPEQAGAMVERLGPQVDLLTVVRGGPYSTGAYRPDGHTEAGFNTDLCRQMAGFAGEARTAAIVLQGSVVDVEAAGRALDEGVCDLVEMTRAQIADAALVTRVRQGRAAHIRPCLLCNQACRVRDNRNPIISCVVDPVSGHETEEPAHDSERAGTASGGGLPAPPVLVVGAGPAGLECARVLAEAGRRVKVAERSDRPGGAVRIAAQGSSRDRLGAAVDWLWSECESLEVEVTTGTSVALSDVRAAQAEGWQIVLATGGRPFARRYPDTTEPLIVDVADALGSGWAEWPDGPVVVYDPVGDAVAISLAERLASETDHPVTLISPDPVAGTLLSRSGDLADANVRLQRAGVERRLRSRVLHVAAGSVAVEEAWTAQRDDIPAAVFVDAGHRVADRELYDQLQDPSVPCAGDCVAPRSILEAVLEGRRVAEALIGAEDGLLSARAGGHR